MCLAVIDGIYVFFILFNISVAIYLRTHIGKTDIAFPSHEILFCSDRIYVEIMDFYSDIAVSLKACFDFKFIWNLLCVTDAL